MTARGRQWPWREHLEPHEHEELAYIDFRAALLDKERRKLTAERNLLVNRAIHRAKYWNRIDESERRAAAKTEATDGNVR